MGPKPDQEMRKATLYAKWLKRVVEGSVSYEAMAEYSGLSYHTVIRYTQALKGQNLVYISGWEQDTRGRDSKPLWSFGKGKDVPRFRLSDAQKQARYRAAKQTKVSSVFALADKINQQQGTASCKTTSDQ